MNTPYRIVPIRSDHTNECWFQVVGPNGKVEDHFHPNSRQAQERADLCNRVHADAIRSVIKLVGVIK